MKDCLWFLYKDSLKIWQIYDIAIRFFVIKLFKYFVADLSMVKQET